MKITIEAETEAERQQRPESLVLTDVISFAVIGDRLPAPVGESGDFAHLHTTGPRGVLILIGQLSAMSHYLLNPQR